MSFSGFPAVIALFIFLAVPLSVIALFFGNLSRFAHRKRQLIQNVIVAEYEPPEDLSPAEIGYLFDSRIGKTELVATLVDLEQRGLVSISYSKLDGIHAETKTTQLPGRLKEHEQFLLNNLGTGSSISLMSLSTILGFKKCVIESLQKRGFIPDRGETIKYFAQRTFVAYFLITVPLFLWLVFTSNGGFISALILIIIIFVISFPFFLGLALVVGFIYNKLAGQPGMWTAKFKTVWPKLEGYRDFVQQVELDELRYESEDLKIRSKNKALAYAIALDLSTDWQKRFDA
jgi:hypothetical protein